MSKLRMLTWSAPSEAELRMKKAVEASQKAVEAAERGEAAEALALLETAEEAAQEAWRLFEPKARPDLREMAEQALCGFAPTPAERSEPLDADQREIDLCAFAHRACWAEPYQRLGLSIETDCFTRPPTGAEKRLFARPGLRVEAVEVTLGPRLEWLRLPLYGADSRWPYDSTRCRLSHVCVVP